MLFGWINRFQSQSGFFYIVNYSTGLLCLCQIIVVVDDVDVLSCCCCFLLAFRNFSDCRRIKFMFRCHHLISICGLCYRWNAKWAKRDETSNDKNQIFFEFDWLSKSIFLVCVELLDFESSTKRFSQCDRFVSNLESAIDHTLVSKHGNDHR